MSARPAARTQLCALPTCTHQHKPQKVQAVHAGAAPCGLYIYELPDQPDQPANFKTMLSGHEPHTHTLTRTLNVMLPRPRAGRGGGVGAARGGGAPRR